jgi:aromatic-L-amino-acid decarboxylase
MRPWRATFHTPRARGRMDRGVTVSDPLWLDREAMRRLGYRVVDMLVEHVDHPSSPPLRRATPAEMRERLDGPPPAGPEDIEKLLGVLERDVLPFASRGDHPGFFAFIPFAGTWPGALGDLIASAANFYTGSWMESAGPSRLELQVLDWFKSWIGFPAQAGGTLVSGGSAANLTALACAREARAGRMTDDLVLYVSDQAHSSLARGARLLGFHPDQVRVLPSTPDLTLRPETLVAAVTAGTTNTGAVDPLPQLADVAREYGLWHHVDAAYGGFSVLTERGREALRGIELADSVTLDPHKWLYQPYECGCILVRDGAALKRAFEIVPDYLEDSRADDGEVNFADLGVQLSRSSRALKCWLSIRYFGLDAFRAAIDRTLDLAELAQRLVEESDALELAAPPSLGVVCFRRSVQGPDEETLIAGLVAALERTGEALVSTTRLHGRPAIRLCVLSHRSDEEHVRAAISFLERAEPAEGLAAFERHPNVLAVLGGPPVEPPPLLELLDVNGAVERVVEPGIAVVEQWETSRDFFVILDGTADVQVDGQQVAELGPGEFFGELAALDWGAGFGYSRLASVVARTPLRVLVIQPEQLNEQVRATPAIGVVIRRAVHERLGRRAP